MKVVNYYIMPILKNMKIIKMHKKFICLNIIKIVLNKMQIILERFCMKIASDTTLQLLGVKKCILYK